MKQEPLVQILRFYHFEQVSLPVSLPLLKKKEKKENIGFTPGFSILALMEISYSFKLGRNEEQPTIQKEICDHDR